MEDRAKWEGLNYIHFCFKCVCLYIFVWCMCRCVHTTAYVETGHNFVELFFSLVWILEMEFTLLGLLGKYFYPMCHLAARRRCLNSDRSILTHGLVPPVVDTKHGSLSSLFCPSSIPTHLSLQAKKAGSPSLVAVNCSTLKMHSCFIGYLGIFCYSTKNWTKSQIQNNKAWLCTFLIIIDIKHWFHIKHFYVFWEMSCQIFFYTFLTEWLAFQLYVYKIFVYFVYSLLIWHTVCNAFYTPIVFCLHIQAPGEPTTIPRLSSSPWILYVH